MKYADHHSDKEGKSKSPAADSGELLRLARRMGEIAQDLSAAERSVENEWTDEAGAAYAASLKKSAERLLRLSSDLQKAAGFWEVDS